MYFLINQQVKYLQSVKIKLKGNSMDEMRDFSEALTAFKEEFGCHVMMHTYTDDLRRNFAFLCGIHANPYCSILKNKLWDTINPQCKYFDCKLTLEVLSRGKKPFYKYCHCGVLELAVPVITGERLSGVLYIGPFRTSPDEMPPDTLICKTSVKGLEKFEAQKQTLAELSRERASRLMKISIMLSSMMGYIVEKSKNDEIPAGSRKERIENFIGNNFRREASLSELASYLFLSESRTTQLLREYFGKGFPELVTEQRINYAKSLLVNSYFTASSIAVQTGFSEAAYFFKVFMKSTGLSPGAYRKKFRKENFQA